MPPAEQAPAWPACINEAGRLAGAAAAPPPFSPEFCGGGGGLYSTGPDYLLSRNAAARRQLNGARILRPESVALMNRNHDRRPPAGVLKASTRTRQRCRFLPRRPDPLGARLHDQLAAGPNGRSAGTVSWAGIFNSYYWLDPARRVAGVILTQICPSPTRALMRLMGEFERGVYDLLKSA